MANNRKYTSKTEHYKKEDKIVDKIVDKYSELEKKRDKEKEKIIIPNIKIIRS